MSISVLPAGMAVRLLYFLELRLQVWAATWMLGMEFRSSGKAASTLYC